MIKVIEGKRYNTDTAEEVYSHTFGLYGDFNYREHTLYLTKGGNWFMYHQGGANTDMAVSVGNNSYGGSADIEPLTADEAYTFLERHSSDSDAYAALERYFSDRIEDA